MANIETLLETEMKARQAGDCRIISQTDELCSKLIGELVGRIRHVEDSVQRGVVARRVNEFLSQQKTEFSALRRSIKAGMETAVDSMRLEGRRQNGNASFSAATSIRTGGRTSSTLKVKMRKDRSFQEGKAPKPRLRLKMRMCTVCDYGMMRNDSRSSTRSG